MVPRPHRIRRARRTDFVAAMELLAASNVPIPPIDRAALRRFRRVVADLGADFYVATVDDGVVGMVHATYARQLAGGPVARIELVVVTPAARRRGVGTSLLRHVELRARKRSCVRAMCDLGAHSCPRESAILFFTRAAWSHDGTMVHVPIRA